MRSICAPKISVWKKKILHSAVWINAQLRRQTLPDYFRQTTQRHWKAFVRELFQMHTTFAYSKIKYEKYLCCATKYHRQNKFVRKKTSNIKHRAGQLPMLGYHKRRIKILLQTFLCAWLRWYRHGRENIKGILGAQSCWDFARIIRTRPFKALTADWHNKTNWELIFFFLSLYFYAVTNRSNKNFH